MKENLARMPFEKNIYNNIMLFLEDKATSSANTRRAYESDIRQFFLEMRNKDIQDLHPIDLVFKYTDILSYKNKLVKKYGKNSDSVNRKIETIKSLYRHFNKTEVVNVKMEIFDVGRVKPHTNSYGVLSWEETVEMIKRARSHSNGEEKSLILEIAARTSIRESAIVNLKWSNVYKENAEDNFWIIEVYDKGEKQDSKPIPDDLYQRMIAIRKEDQDKIFTISTKTCQRLIGKLCEEMGIPEERNIKFHSIKKVGINWIIDATGDISKGAEQGNHSNIQTTYKHYKLKSKNWTQMAGILMGQKLDFSVLESLSKADLLKLIKSSNLTTQVDLLSRAKKKSKYEID